LLAVFLWNRGSARQIAGHLRGARIWSPKTLPLTVIVAKSYIQSSIIQLATDNARPTGFQKLPFQRKHQQPLVQFSGSKGLSPHVRKN
jgi:hypothetical protein